MERDPEAVPIGLVFREGHQHVLWGKEYCRLLEQDCMKGISSAGKASATAYAFPAELMPFPEDMGFTVSCTKTHSLWLNLIHTESL